MILVLSSCAGTGYNNYADIAPIMEENPSAKVFILRDMGFAGSAALVHLSLNGTKIGELGEGEMTVGNGQIGNNVLSAEMGGLAGLGMNEPTKTFEISDGENKYFIIGLKMGIIQSKMLLNETVKESWKDAALD